MEPKTGEFEFWLTDERGEPKSPRVLYTAAQVWDVAKQCAPAQFCDRKRLQLKVHHMLALARESRGASEVDLLVFADGDEPALLMSAKLRWNPQGELDIGARTAELATLKALAVSG